MKEVFGYARVSTEAQNLDMQIDMLKTSGVEEHNIFAEKESGSKKDRKQLELLLSKLRQGDEVLFYDLTRVGRNLVHLITLIDWFRERKISFRDLTNPAVNNVSVETANGWVIFAFNAMLAEFNRKKSNENVIRGLEAARKRGKKGGRRPGPTNRLKEKAPLAVLMHKNPDTSLTDIKKALNISGNSVYKCFEIEGYDYTKHHKNRANNNRIKNNKILIK